MQVQESDMHRVATATGAQTQTTVNNLNPKVLGTVEAFEEKQVRPTLTSWVWNRPLAGLICRKLLGAAASHAYVLHADVYPKKWFGQAVHAHAVAAGTRAPILYWKAL